MPTIKKIWRDNTMPPTNYIWMKTNLKKELVGIYEWYNGMWHEIELNHEGSDVYTKTEVDTLLQYTEQEIVRKLATGEYRILVDDFLSLESENPVQNKVITAELNKKLDKVDYIIDGAIPQEDYPWLN